MPADHGRALLVFRIANANATELHTQLLHDSDCLETGDLSPTAGTAAIDPPGSAALARPLLLRESAIPVIAAFSRRARRSRVRRSLRSERRAGATAGLSSSARVQGAKRLHPAIQPASREWLVEDIAGEDS